MTHAVAEQASTTLGKPIEIRLSGFGGQGVVLAGVILGRAAAVNAGRNAVMAQSYGPESRGGASCAEVMIADGEIPYPHVVDPDVVVVFSHAAYEKYGPSRPERALLIAEENLVHLDPEKERGRPVLRVPFTALAEKIGRKITLNMVALGALCRGSQVVPREALREAISVSVPEGTAPLNLRAFDAGYDYVDALLQSNGK